MRYKLRDQISKEMDWLYVDPYCIVMASQLPNPSFDILLSPGIGGWANLS